MSYEKSKTILVSGSSGLLGHELITQLLHNTNYKVIALTSQTDQLKKQFTDEKLTVLNINSWFEHVDKNQVDVFINCAFPRSSKPDELAQGLEFTEDIVNKAISGGIKGIINISSQSVYSQKEKDRTDEKAEISPESLYGMAKYASERIIASLCEKENINYSNIRLASLTGLDFDVRMTNRFVKMAIDGETITINGGDQLISYLEVRDAAEALIKMLEVDECEWEKQYNLGNNNSFSLKELIEIIKSTGNKYGINNIEVIYKEGNSNFNNLVVSDLFYQEFNWKPKYSVKEMVEELFKKIINSKSKQGDLYV